MPRGRIPARSTLAVLTALALASLVVGAASAGASCAPHDSVCEYQESLHTEPAGPLIVGTLPGAIQPQPVNVAEMEAFWANVDARRARGKLVTATPDSWQLRLVPALRAGWSGWCAVVQASPAVRPACPVDPTAGVQIAWEAWEADGAATRGFALTASEVDGVVVDEGSLGYESRPVPGFAGLREASVQIAAPYPPPWSDLFEPLIRGVRVSSERGFAPSAHAVSVSYPANGWHSPQTVPDGVCRIATRRLPRLHARSGDVLASLTPTAGIAGRGLLSCANTRFTLGRSSLQAAILLDAAEPGRATPVGLPGATSVPGRAALFAAPGREGTILARRAGRAWLLVEGAGLAARERLLSVLRAIVID